MRLEVKQESFRLEVLMSRLQSECFNLCCTDLRHNELTMKEVECVDQCAVKYLQTNKIINSAIGRGERRGGMAQKLKL
uniref:Mitochondrial import inner membrane translocase subunit n=1 Tax=Trypanosoma vivax (strain Y486) TaxID=1055687 RepID=G0TY21_TRYVY|nr:conserved hypothetical protein [Trypanosoma vivax Y486]